MRSMTGFGRATAEHEGDQVTIEIYAVNNRKQADVRVALPRELAGLEPVLRTRLQETVNRGSLTVSVSYALNAENRQGRFRVDAAVGAHLVRSLQELARATGIRDDIRVGDLLLVPGLIAEDLAVPAAALRVLALKALDLAIAEVRHTQTVEGEALRRDLLQRQARLREVLNRIRDSAEGLRESYRQRLRDRIRLLGVDLPVDDERLAKEVAFHAERADITEETVRLESHLDRFAQLLDTEESPGRSLEFLCQEMHREISTLCAKASETKVVDLGLALKAELGRIREQILNVE